MRIAACHRRCVTDALGRGVEYMALSKGRVAIGSALRTLNLSAVEMSGLATSVDLIAILVNLVRVIHEPGQMVHSANVPRLLILATWEGITVSSHLRAIGCWLGSRVIGVSLCI